MNRKYLFIEQDIETLREKIKNTDNGFFKRLYEQCRLYSSAQLTEEHPKGSSTFMGMAAANLSLAYILTKQDHYLEEAKRWILTGCRYPHWGHAHLVDVDLSASWLLFGYSVAYDWIKDELEKEERTLIKDKLILQGERMYDFAVKTKGEGWSTAFWQNHNWINLTGQAAAGYALGKEYEHSELWTEYAKENFKIVYDVMADDGSDYEGVVYWRYGAMWLLMYAHLLKEREGFNYFEHSGFLQNTFYYRLYQSAPNLEEIINYGDCHDRRSGHSAAMYYKFASEYKNGHAQKLANKVRNEFLFREQYESGVKPGILPEAWLELIWSDSSVEEEEFDNLPLVKYWDDLGLVVMRSGWEKDAIHFSIKCGTPGGKKQWERSWEMDRKLGWKTRGLSHQHPDNNSFILNAFDAFLAVDEGYNRTVKASEHNIVIVDGKGYEHEGGNNIWKETPYETKGTMDFTSKNGITLACGEAAKMYAKELQLKKYYRNVIYTENGHFYMLDELRSEKEHTYTWLMNSDTIFKKAGEDKYLMENGPAKLEVFTLYPEKKSVSSKETNVRAIMTTQEPDKYRETKMKTMVIENREKSKDMYFFNILKPQRTFDEEEISVSKFAEDECFGSVIESKTYKEIFLFNPLKKNIQLKNIKTDAKWVVIVEKDGKVSKFGMNMGSTLIFKGEKLAEKNKTENLFLKN
ncbi:DUF4962 domain-containing protein [Ilyobacter polytropus]|uniref:Heparinase II/III family protein n=1 Tax=Ilyobacter polytropus (strain ATCC 51220 / DSM 2926 / LMG 16218 / CuHBu1) TaxID=572544 RepID=E3HC58_ILYPC|nr:DUF4962 domain-containing protein [Ilyobacter polytropus]ADO83901.1 Heparinase II/III family protein [Ilyobacter polytropus DSM 2926]